MPCMLLLKLLEHVYDCLCHSKPGGLFCSFFSHGWVSSFSCLLSDLVAVMISQSLVTLFSGDLSILLQLIQLIKYLRNSQYL
jgi:hypothetical protein